MPRSNQSDLQTSVFCCADWTSTRTTRSVAWLTLAHVSSRHKRDCEIGTGCLSQERGDTRERNPVLVSSIDVWCKFRGHMHMWDVVLLSQLSSAGPFAQRNAWTAHRALIYGSRQMRCYSVLHVVVSQYLQHQTCFLQPPEATLQSKQHPARDSCICKRRFALPAIWHAMQFRPKFHTLIVTFTYAYVTSR